MKTKDPLFLALVIITNLVTVCITIGVILKRREHLTRGHVSRATQQCCQCTAGLGYDTVVIMASNQALTRRRFVFSLNDLFSAGLDKFGNFVLRQTGTSTPLWSSANQGGTGAAVSYLQANGNLVLITETGTVAWASNTAGNPGAKLQLTNSGKLSLVAVDETILWAVGLTSVDTLSPTTSRPSEMPSSLSRDWPSVSPSFTPFVTNSPATSRPSEYPSLSPSHWPSIHPTDDSSVSSTPSLSPSDKPSTIPSRSPSLRPSSNPSNSWVPSSSPSSPPSRAPSQFPSFDPSADPSTKPSQNPSHQPTANPTSAPSETFRPTSTPSVSLNLTTSLSPTNAPSAMPSYPAIINYTSAIVLKSNNNILKGTFFFSQNGDYSVGLAHTGDLVVIETLPNRTVWSSASEGGIGGVTCNLQGDGNFVLRNENGKTLWKTNTQGNRGAQLELDDGGQLSIFSDDSILWIAGKPHGNYRGPPNTTLGFPLRGMFYYPWFPETWTVNSVPAKYNPTLGRYSSGNVSVQEAHVKALEYAHVDVAIASWWGPGSLSDRARITNLMMKSTRTKWTVYHEQELNRDPSVAEIRSDLAYLKKWFAWQDSWAYVNGKPLIFVYNEGNCSIADRWMEASDGEWFVVLKLFPKYKKCPTQPDQWHQYGVEGGALYYPGVSFTISPGFWRADLPEAKLPRVSYATWRQNVGVMVNSSAPLQLIISFNEWGEGSSTEPATEWASPSGYGHYLDILHEIY